VCGGVIPQKDYQYLRDRGVAAIFGPGTNVVDAARAVVHLLEGRLRNADRAGKSDSSQLKEKLASAS